MREYNMRNNNRIFHDDQTVLEEIFYQVDHATCSVLTFCDSNADTRYLQELTSLLK